ncbi:EboA domain-containing protein [Kineosporia mesophila]|uniref:EboA domain-containing protein n=1 Tax=Kineosporia mesophila TaxID=566012 RepID=A0ABP7AFB1_9ACTN|nr:EboA domain-containing protein [Kineosporia mesophila]MCD5354366.1 EboA domain-containing protein [Kineosporia mesophila]
MTITSSAEIWVRSALVQVRADPTTIRRWFPMAARKVGAEHESVRIRLLRALPDRSEIPALYRYGDVHERRAIILSAAQLGVDDVLLELARDAFRSNDPRLVTASANPAVVERLTDEEVDQVLMKCVFMEIPLDRVPALTRRATARTSKMLAGFVLERVCAGRSVAPEVWPVIDRFPPSGELARIEQQLTADDPERRRAASAALDRRGAPL